MKTKGEKEKETATLDTRKELWQQVTAKEAEAEVEAEVERLKGAREVRAS